MNYRTQGDQLARLKKGEKFILGGIIFVVKETDNLNGYAMIIPLKNYKEGKQKKHTQMMHLYKNVERLVEQN
jgi:hypothetical protein